MVTPELLDFLRAQLATGMSQAEVERLLVEEGGWDKSDVEEGLAQIGLPPVTVAPTAATPPAEVVTSMDVDTAPITAQERVIVYEPMQIEQATPPALPQEQQLAPVVSQSEPVTLAVRSERPVIIKYCVQKVL